MLKTTKAKSETSNKLVEELFQAGAHYGYRRSRRHPSVSSYIYATKGNTDLIDLEKTLALLDTASEFVKMLGAQGKVVLLVGTKPEAREAIKEAALKLKMPYTMSRWIGGTLSNFGEIKKKIVELENYQKEGKEALEKYTKKERVLLAKKMKKLEAYYGGLIGIKKLPEAVFVIDPRAEAIAVTEAKKCGLPVIALANSDSNITPVDYPILGNDASIPSIKLITQSIAEAYERGRASSEVPAAAKVAV